MEMQTMNDPKRVYCASKLFRAKLWRDWKSNLSPRDFTFVSTWHDNENVEKDEQDYMKCYEGWTKNIHQILDADHMVVFANDGDRLNGTLVEIGIALSHHVEVHLCGSFQWGTWRFQDVVAPPWKSLYHAFNDIYGKAKGPLYVPTNKELLHDPS